MSEPTLTAEVKIVGYGYADDAAEVQIEWWVETFIEGELYGERIGPFASEATAILAARDLGAMLANLPGARDTTGPLQ